MFESYRGYKYKNYEFIKSYIIKFKVGNKVRIKTLEEINKINSRYNIFFPEFYKFLCNEEGIITQSRYDPISTLYVYILTFPNFPEHPIAFFETELSSDRASITLSDKEFIDIQQWL